VLKLKSEKERKKMPTLLAQSASTEHAEISPLCKTFTRKKRINWDFNKTKKKAKQKPYGSLGDDSLTITISLGSTRSISS